MFSECWECISGNPVFAALIVDGERLGALGSWTMGTCGKNSLEISDMCICGNAGDGA
jgi:hypothetical protein